MTVGSEVGAEMGISVGANVGAGTHTQDWQKSTVSQPSTSISPPGQPVHSSVPAPFLWASGLSGASLSTNSVDDT